MLFEVIGLGCGFGPLNNRFFPPLGSILYWLRPNTIRLPPWPNRMPLTNGDARTPFDVLLYARPAGGAGRRPVLQRHRADPGARHHASACCRCGRSGTILGLLAVAGLRGQGDLPGRPRRGVRAPSPWRFLFVGYGVDMIIAAKLVCLAIWMGAATSKLNKHFPFVISTMMSATIRWSGRSGSSAGSSSTSPTICVRAGCRGSSLTSAPRSRCLVPLVLLFSHGGWPTAIAAFVMLCFHFGILSAIPMGVPLEWNVFMMFCVLTLFVGHAEVGLGDMTHAAARSCCSRCVAGTVVLGNLFPRKVSFLPGHAVLRGQLGHHAGGASSRRPTEKIEADSSPSPACRHAQLEKVLRQPGDSA